MSRHHLQQDGESKYILAAVDQVRSRSQGYFPMCFEVLGYQPAVAHEMVSLLGGLKQVCVICIQL